MSAADDIEEFPTDAIPLRLAPFAVADIASVTEKLICLTGADEAIVMPKAGKFSVWFLNNRMREIKYSRRTGWNPRLPILDYSLGSSATFAPYDLLEYPEYYRELLPMLEWEWRLFLDAVGAIWEKMLDKLAGAIEGGKLELRARVGDEMAPSITSIPISSWANFLVDDWASGSATSAQTGSRLLNIHVCPVCMCQPSLKAEGKAPPAAPDKIPIRPPSAAKALSLLKDLRARVAPRAPTNAEDEAEIERAFPGAPRKHARKARKALEPPGGYKPGPAGSRNPAAKK